MPSPTRGSRCSATPGGPPALPTRGHARGAHTARGVHRGHADVGALGRVAGLRGPDHQPAQHHRRDGRGREANPISGRRLPLRLPGMPGVSRRTDARGVPAGSDHVDPAVGPDDQPTPVRARAQPGEGSRAERVRRGGVDVGRRQVGGDHRDGRDVGRRPPAARVHDVLTPVRRAGGRHGATAAGDAGHERGRVVRVLDADQPGLPAGVGGPARDVTPATEAGVGPRELREVPGGAVRPPTP